ncbi:hypothetical protein R5R35_006327 [Gryllus longicercus]
MEATRAVVSGRRHVLQFHLRFPRGKPVPSLLTLTVNDYDVCRARGAESDALSTISLESALSTGVSGAPQVSGYEFSAAGGAGAGGGGDEGFDPGAFDPETPRPRLPPARPFAGPFARPFARPTPWPTRPQPQDPFPSESWVEPDTPRPRPKPSPPPSRPAGGSGEPLLDPTKCGVAKVPNALVVNGFEAAKGQWPWQAALYAKNETESYNIVFSFQCGGTLVSRKHVVSAAHCVVNLQEKREVQVISVGDMYVRLGKHNLKKAETEEQHRQVQKIAVHPDFTSSTLRNDIAVIHLTEVVTINTFVTPVCLWDREVDLNLVVGKLGTVGGWGRHEGGALSDTLRIARMPVVSQETCLRSDKFFFEYTSENTFCAGFRNGTAACNGDSGGGLHFSLENPRQGGSKTWYFRGVVSLSMTRVEDGGCDPNNFIVFTDVAKYMTWLVNQFI